MDIWGTGDVEESVQVRRRDGHSLTARFPADGSVVNPNGDVRINVVARYESRAGACSRGCKDRAPDIGIVTAP